MPAISPSVSAQLARDVYVLTDFKTLGDAFSFLGNTYKGLFSFGGDNLIKGKTGGLAFMKCRTAFGFNLIGSGPLEGHIFVLFRGTRYLADWLTNVNAMVSRSACGEAVHDGFNQSFLMTS